MGRERVGGGVPFGGEFSFFVGAHEGRGEAERAQAQGSLGASADIVDESDGSFVEFFLVVILVLDHV